MANKDEILRKALSEINRLKSREQNSGVKERELEMAEKMENMKIGAILESAELMVDAMQQNALDQELLGETVGRAVSDAIAKIKIEAPASPEVNVTVPEIKIPEIKVPDIQVNVPKAETPKWPAFKIPEIKLPTINVPAPQVTINNPDEVSLRGVSDKQPLPVKLMDLQGRPFAFPVGGGGGGKTDFLTIKGFSQSAFAEISTPDGRLKVDADSDDILTELRVNNGGTAMLVALNSGNSTITYQAWGEPGTAVTAASWRLRRITDPGGGAGLTQIEYADGDRNFDNTWSGREADSFS